MWATFQERGGSLRLNPTCGKTAINHIDFICFGTERDIPLILMLEMDMDTTGPRQQ